MKPLCSVCNKHKKGQTRKISVKQAEYFKCKGKNVVDGDIICNPCRQTFYTKKGHVSTDNPESTPTNTSNGNPKPDTVTLPIMSVGKTSRICGVCKAKNTKLTVMPEKARLAVFISQGILVPVGVRCCPAHLDGKTLKPGLEIDKARLRKTKSEVSATDIMWLLDRLRSMVSVASKKRLDFDDTSALSDDDILNLTGINREHFDFLVTAVSKLKKRATEPQGLL